MEIFSLVLVEVSRPRGGSKWARFLRSLVR